MSCLPGDGQSQLFAEEVNVAFRTITTFQFFNSLCEMIRSDTDKLPR